MLIKTDIIITPSAPLIVVTETLLPLLKNPPLWGVEGTNPALGSVKTCERSILSPSLSKSIQ